MPTSESPSPTPACGDCARFDQATGLGAGFCEESMSYREPDQSACELFQPAQDSLDGLTTADLL